MHGSEALGRVLSMLLHNAAARNSQAIGYHAVPIEVVCSACLSPYTPVPCLTKLRPPLSANVSAHTMD